jgi:DNA-binding transcriptional MerR regulator
MSLKLTHKPGPADLEQPQYSAQELLDAFKQAMTESRGEASSDEDRGTLTLRTLHYYLNIGLLPGPIGKGRWSRYSRDHLNRLLLIRRLQDAHMPLSVIRQTLEALAPKQVVQQLATLPASPAAGPGPAEARSPRGQAAEPASSAADYVAQVLAAQQQARRAVREQRTPPAGDGLQKTLPLFDEPDASSQAWERIELAPGVELHVRSPVTEALRQEIDRVVEFARRRFKRRST